MFGSSILEVFIGLILVFLIVSIICTAVREGIESLRKTRAAYLERGIRELLEDPDGTQLAKNIYEHPIVSGLYSGPYKSGLSKQDPDWMEHGDNLPSYIPSGNFAVALMDILARGPVDRSTNANTNTATISVDTIKANLSRIGNPKVERVFLTAIDFAGNDINKLQSEIERWFDSGMNRVSGWYKRSTSFILFVIAIVVAISLNVNTISIVNYLARNDAARKIIVERAASVVNDSGFVDRGYQEAKKDLEDLNLPIGWKHGIASAYVDGENSESIWSVGIGPLLGWLITALAATLGAPFWFDMLNKVIVIRSTVKPNEKSKGEASKDSK